jgi:glycosyltransferase involved in cell wall biosynthesis
MNTVPSTGMAAMRPSSSDRLQVLVNARHLAGPRTGIEVYMEQLLAALSRTGQVEITALSWAPLELDLPWVHEMVPVRRPDLSGIRATLWKLWFDQWYSLRAVLPSSGILFHGMDGFLPYSLRSRDRCVATVHDLGWHAHPELFNRRLRLMYRALFPWVVRRADHFIAVSRYTADDLMHQAGVPASKIDVVYHGLDPIFTTHGKIPGTAQSSSPYLLAMGGISPARKNTRRLIEAFTRWRSRGGHRASHQLLITGVSLDRDLFQNGAAAPPGVTYLGYVEKAELPRLYAGAAAFLYPGIYEGFGLPIIEAMACGAPVLTSRTGAAPEIAGGAAILVDPFDIESIVAGLEHVTMPEEAARLRDRGHERTRLFDWSSAAAATVDVYRQLMR